MLPDGWKEKSFGDVVNVANGLIDPREASFKNTKHIGPENVISDTGRIVNERTCGDLKLISGKYQFDKNSIVYSKIRPNLNKVCAPSYSGVCSADMYVLRPREEIDKNFLFFIILDDSFKNRAISMSMRTGMPKINREDLSSIPLLLPPLPEQKKIAAILSTWDRAIEGTEKLLANSQQQKKALMQQLLTGKKRLPGFTGEWKTKTFLDIFNLKIGGTPSRSNPAYWDTDKITENRWVAISDLRTAKIRKTAEHISDLGAKKSNCSLIPKGTIILSFKLTIGKKAILLEDCYTNEAICALIIKDKNEINSSYVYQALDNVNYEEEIDQAVKGKTLNKEKLARLRILAPPLPEQKAIAAVLSTADEEITALESDLSRLRQEKKALMQQLLTGKIRVAV